MSLSNSIKYSLSNSHIMTILNRSSHKDSKKSLFAPIEKETMFGSDFVQLDVSLDHRTFRQTSIGWDDNVYMDEDWIGVRLDGRGSNRRTFSWTRIGSAYVHTYTYTHIHTHSYIYKLNIISLYINSLNKLPPNLHQIKYHNLQFKKFTQKN